MAFFTAIGVISNDIVRRETKNGVVTTFRLETGAPRGRKLWIDIECWGQLAGNLARYGEKGRAVSVAGRLAEKSWLDRSTNHHRSRLLVIASDVSLENREWTPLILENQLVVAGQVSTPITDRTHRSWRVVSFSVRVRTRRSDCSSLDLRCEAWRPKEEDSPPGLQEGRLTALCGSVRFDSDAKSLVLVARRLGGPSPD